MKRRRLRVSRTHPESRSQRFPHSLPQPIPLLRVRGRWLDEAGFTIGAEVRIVVARGLLALEVIDTETDQAYRFKNFLRQCYSAAFFFNFPCSIKRRTIGATC